MKWHLSRSLGLIALLTVLVGSGCAQLRTAMQGGGEAQAQANADAEFQSAMKNGDLERLKSICSTREVNGTKLSFKQKNEACAETSKLMAAEMDAMECDKIDAAWNEFKEVNTDVKSQMHNSYGEKLAKCDRWDTLFVDLMHWGQAWDRGSNGYKVLARIDEAGEPVEDKFLTYLDETDKPLDIEHAGYAMSHFLKWRMDKEEGKSCDAYVPAMDKLPSSAKHNLLVYFKEVECEPAASAAAASLGADSPSTRIVACELLGKVGTAAHLKKLKIVAEKDGYSKEKNRTVIYPVRDACSQAMAKVELRQ